VGALPLNPSNRGESFLSPCTPPRESAINASGSSGIKGATTEIGSHTLRKTFARLLYAALGHDLVRTSYALRHRSVATTVAYYLSFREEEVDAAIVGI